MTWAGLRVPIIVWTAAFIASFTFIAMFYFREQDLQMVLSKGWAELLLFLGFQHDRFVDLTLSNGDVVRGPMFALPHHPDVLVAWDRMLRICRASLLFSVFICGPLTIWYFGYSKRRGEEILTERHERGAFMVSRLELARHIDAFNADKRRDECSAYSLRTGRSLSADKLECASPIQSVRRGIHAPYTIGTVRYPWRLEQSHAMLIGTTGAGKTTQLKSLIAQARERGHSLVVFDLTDSFVESFYDESRDVILNPMDERCEPWTIFADCESYADFLSAADAMIPRGRGDDDFWQAAARTMLTETCVKLSENGFKSNGALAWHLMEADLKRIAAMLRGTIAAPFASTEAPKMAESVRATLNVNANALRFLPDPERGRSHFSIKRWMAHERQPGSILFITSNHADLILNRPLLTLWMNIAVAALFECGRTRDLRTWFLFDEVHALHRLPAIEHGLQTARAVGGAFVLGMHSFDKLAETYGEKGATNLASLARTKLVLAASDKQTAQKCADFIGNREVRQMDEAYSYGYNNSRDASTITPRKQIEALVMPDDITNLPSLHGYLKFPDGFPAARVELEWKDYPPVAPGSLRVTDMRAAPYTPPDKDAGVEKDDAGADANDCGQQNRCELSDEADPTDTAQLAHRSGKAVRVAVGRETRSASDTTGRQSSTGGSGSQTISVFGKSAGLAASSVGSNDRVSGSLFLQGRESRGTSQSEIEGSLIVPKRSGQTAPRIEDQVLKENRLGIGSEEASFDAPQAESARGRDG